MTNNPSDSMKRAASKKREKSSSRFVIHMGIVAIVFILMILSWEDHWKIAVATVLCGGILLADVYRLISWHLFVQKWKGKPLLYWPRYRLFLIRATRYLIKRTYIRGWACNSPSTATPLALVFLVLMFNFPLWQVAPITVSFAMGDAAAREIGTRIPSINLLGKYGRKTLAGYLAYVFSGAGVAMLLLLVPGLYAEVPHAKYLPLVILGSTMIAGAVEVLCGLIPRAWAKFGLDDNLFVPPAGYAAFVILYPF